MLDKHDEPFNCHSCKDREGQIRRCGEKWKNEFDCKFEYFNEISSFGNYSKLCESRCSKWSGIQTRCTLTECKNHQCKDLKGEKRNVRYVWTEINKDECKTCNCSCKQGSKASTCTCQDIELESKGTDKTNNNACIPKNRRCEAKEGQTKNIKETWKEKHDCKTCKCKCKLDKLGIANRKCRCSKLACSAKNLPYSERS